MQSIVIVNPYLPYTNSNTSKSIEIPVNSYHLTPFKIRAHEVPQLRLNFQLEANCALFDFKSVPESFLLLNIFCLDYLRFVLFGPYLGHFTERL